LRKELFAMRSNQGYPALLRTDVAVLLVLSLSCASAANTSTRALNPWTATGLTTCSIINGHKVESEFMMTFYESAVFALGSRMTVDSKEAYEKCKAGTSAEPARMRARNLYTIGLRLSFTRSV